ncbi:hypothetical protein KSP39_PZI010871 [Platanthera zijinensis]|uniref:Polyprotein n=1 Tax=Platanthera zijinensis TaxID=2320716 RepID=A0AAP0G5T7_9ASPA
MKVSSPTIPLPILPSYHLVIPPVVMPPTQPPRPTPLLVYTRRCRSTNNQVLHTIQEPPPDPSTSLQEPLSLLYLPYPSLHLGKTTIGCKWIFSVKQNFQGLADHYKTWLVARGCTHIAGIDYQETFASVAKMNFIQILLLCVVCKGWSLSQLNVKMSSSMGIWKRKCICLYRQVLSLKDLRVPKSHDDIQVNDIVITGDDMKEMQNLKTRLAREFGVELVCKITTVLLQTHHSQLTTTPAARPVLTVLKDILHAKVKAYKDTIGFNLAAMDHLKELMSMRSDAPFRDAKSKLTEIRRELSKRSEKSIEGKRRKKKQKNSSANQPVPS